MFAKISLMVYNLLSIFIGYIKESNVMKISEEEVKHIASLAKLDLSVEEVEKYATQLGEIREFVEKLNEVDITGVKPTAHILDIQNVFRKDEVKDSFPREEILKNAPSKEAGCISVPKVVE